MKPRQILSTLRGLSIIGTGASWQPPESEMRIAGRLVAFLKDRRVLLNNYELEIPQHCVDSILDIRSFITEQLGELKGRDATITDNLEGIRAACRRFLNTVQGSGHRVILDNSFQPGSNAWDFFTALGELRATIGISPSRHCREAQSRG